MHSYIIKNSVLGLALVGNVCNRQGKVSTSLDLAVPDVVMAHELGHNLGANHDTNTLSEEVS